MVTAIILAAGASSRMQRTKQLLAYRGRPMLRQVAETVLNSQVEKVIVVLGHQFSAVSEALAGFALEVVFNPDYSLGMSSSLKAGLNVIEGAELMAPETEAVLFVLADQPLLKTDTINMLIEGYKSGGKIVAPSYKGVRGNPVLFDKQYFAEIAGLQGDVGAREVVECHPDHLRLVEVEDPGVLRDVDTWNDYLKLT